MADEVTAAILNVNDDEVGRYTVSRMLSAAGFAVTEAASGQEALHLAAATRPDLVVLDIKLPDISGLEVCRRLKADPLTRSIPVLQTSATFTTSEKRVQGLDSGADGYLTQPLEPPELVATVRALLRARRAEEAARTAAREWQATFDAISDGVCLLDRDGRVARCNRAAVAMLAREGVPGPRGEAFEQVLGLALACAPPFTFKTVAGARERRVAEIELDGGARWLRVLADPVFDERGAWSGAVLVLTDVSERKNFEYELRRRAEALVDADRRKDEFLAMLAHELRNPLSAITAALHLLDLPGADAARATRVRGVLDRQTRHLTRLVDDLLDVSRITRGKVELRRREVDLLPIVQQAVLASRALIDARRHELVVEMPPALETLEADPTRLEQVVANLLDNAAKYTEPGGRIVLSLERAERDARPWAVLRVRDSGIGIAPEMLGRVFDLFAQVDASLDRSRGGLGIGLTLVRSLVEMHGGSVTVDSAGLGQGSEFVIALPLLALGEVGATGARTGELALGRADRASERGDARRAANDDGGAAAAARSHGALRVLLVEDNPDAREMLRSLLESWGHAVDVAEEGSRGLSLAFDRAPHVALVDIGLPGLDGYQFAQRLRATAAGRGVHLVALTGYGRREDRKRALDAGFDVHLVKPVDPHELSRLLAGLVATLHGNAYDSARRAMPANEAE